MAGSNKIDQLNPFSYDGRLESFKLARWPQFKSATTAKSHRISPDSMAAAGFHARPIEGSVDNAACPYCCKNLDGWGPEDEAWAEHLAHSGGCPLAGLGQQVNRELTFTMAGWPHSGSIGPTKMAKAGFFFWPKMQVEDDTVICVQCGLALDGWEPNDDPRHEHERRRPKCPFLVTGSVHSPTHCELLLASLDTEGALREWEEGTMASVGKKRTAVPKIVNEPVPRKRPSSATTKSVTSAVAQSTSTPKFKMPAVKPAVSVPVVSKEVPAVNQTPIKQAQTAPNAATIKRISARRSSIRNAAVVVEDPKPSFTENPAPSTVGRKRTRQSSISRQSLTNQIPQFKLPELPNPLMSAGPSIPSTPLGRKALKAPAVDIKIVLEELAMAGLSFTSEDLTRPLTQVLNSLVERKMSAFDESVKVRFAAFAEKASCNK